MNGWSRVVGHEWAVAHLAAAVRQERIGHAYLITGPAQTGKTTLARTLAMALNCQGEEEARPCGRCRACTLIAVGRHPDVRLLMGEVSGRGRVTIKVDQIRGLRQELSLAPYEARWKVAILKRFDAAAPSAANAFLKTLEEPPSGVVLVLTAADADSLLPTITSRCRTLALRPLPATVIERALRERWEVGAEKAQLLAHLAAGRLGWAVGAAQDERLLKEREEQMGALQTALDGGRVGRFAVADKLSQKPEVLPGVLRTWLSWWRDLALLSWGGMPASALTNVDRRGQLEGLAGRWTAGQVRRGLQRTEMTLWQLERNANTRLALENLLLAYPWPAPERWPPGGQPPGQVTTPGDER